MKSDDFKVRDFGLMFYIWLLLLIGAYGLGIYGIYDTYSSNETISGNLLNLLNIVTTIPSNYILYVLIIVLGLFLLGIIVSLIEVWIMSYIGAEFISTIIFGGTIALIGAGVYVTFVMKQMLVGIILLSLSVFVGTIVLLLGRKIVLGAKIFEMSCEAVNENKISLIPVLFFSFVSAVNFILGLAGSLYTAVELPKTDLNQWQQYLIFFGLFYVYIMLYWTMLYFSDAINICIFKRWNNYKDSSLRVAIKEVFKVKGSIVMFGMFMAFFDWIIKVIHYFMEKKIREGTKFYKVWSVIKKVLTVIFFLIIVLFRWLFRIIKFLNYYTLAIIVVDKQGFFYSIRKSVELSTTSAADIIIGKIGVGIAKGMFSFISFAFFATTGYLLGYHYIGPEFGIAVSGTASGIFGFNMLTGFSLLLAGIFIAFGYFPSTAILRPISTAYKTILYFYITDPYRGNPGRRNRIDDSEDIKQSLSRVKENVLKDYDEKSRPTWSKKSKEKSETNS